MPQENKLQQLTSDQLKLVIDATGVGVWDWHMQSGKLVFNERWAEIIGYTVEELLPIDFDTWATNIHPEDLELANRLLEAHWLGESDLYEIEARMKHKNGQYVWVLATGKTIEWHKDGKPSRMIGTHLDITQRKLNEQDFITTSQLLDESQKIARVGGWELDLKSGNLFWTAETYRIHDTSPAEFDPTVDAGVSYFLPTSKQLIIDALDAAIERGEGYDLELETYTTKGRKIDVRTTCVVTLEDNKPVKLTGIFQDISEQKAIQRRIEKSNRELENLNAVLKFNAHYDSLTGLPNRVLLADRMRQCVARCQRSGKFVAIVFIDLDRFKEINDAHGHSVGDKLLCSVSEQLKNTMRKSDTLARIGGDEFVAILDDLENPQDCELLLARMLKAVSKKIFIDSKTLQVSASIGVTIYPLDDSNSDQLVRHADQAMYIAKQIGKNFFHIFDVAKDVEVKHQHGELEGIRSALRKNEFVLFYQPKLNMRTNEVIGAEALIRWQHPELGILPPAKFLPAIEENLLIVDLGEWVIENALRQLETWDAAGVQLPISVNISPLQLEQSDFVQRFQQILKQYPNFSSGNIEFEILETSALSDVHQVSSVINDCRDLGVAFSIDDFGTGYSSLTYLKRLHAEYLKIDQSFIREMLIDADDRAIVQGIIELAKAFDRNIIAEGVETIAHGKKLLSMGCDLAQGYGIAKPMPAEEMPHWLGLWQKSNQWQDL